MPKEIIILTIRNKLKRKRLEEYLECGKIHKKTKSSKIMPKACKNSFTRCQKGRFWWGRVDRR
jgi:hypothetical protein